MKLTRTTRRWRSEVNISERLPKACESDTRSSVLSAFHTQVEVPSILLKVMAKVTAVKIIVRTENAVHTKKTNQVSLLLFQFILYIFLDSVEITPVDIFLSRDFFNVGYFLECVRLVAAFVFSTEHFGCSELCSLRTKRGDQSHALQNYGKFFTTPM
jgi:hypothetical protein